MASSSAATVDEYVAELPADRREAIQAVRELINRLLPAGYQEGVQYGMIGWYVPLSRFGETYNGQPLSYVGLASQKRAMSLYLNNVYGDADTDSRFREAWAASGKKLDMGKSCVRFRSVDDLALDAVADAVAGTDVETFIARYREGRAQS